MPLLTTGAGKFAAAAGGGGAPLDGLTGVTGAWSVSRKLLTAYGGSFYTIDTGINSLLDQTGLGSRNITQAITANQPAVVNTGTNSRAAARFNGTTNVLGGSGAAPVMSTLFAAGVGYAVASFIIRAITTSSATIYDNDAVWCDAGANLGLHLHSTNGIVAYNYDADVDTSPVAASMDTRYVAEWIHSSPNLDLRINGTTAGTTDTSSGSSVLSSSLLLGGNSSATYTQIDIFELVTFNTMPSGGERDALVANMAAWVG